MTEQKNISFVQTLIGKFLPAKKKKVSEEEVIQLLEEGERSGAIDKTEHELIKSILEFTDTTVKEVMVPRTDVFAVDISTQRDRLLQSLIDQGFTRVPVYRDSIDNIIGIIYTKDLIGMLEHRDLIILQDVIRPAYLVPESKKISVLLKELQALGLDIELLEQAPPERRRASIMVVSDESIKTGTDA